MTRFLQRLGVPDRCYELLDTVTKCCDHCNAFKPVPRRPRLGAESSGHFGDVLVVDLFYMCGMCSILMIDEAIRKLWAFSGREMLTPLRSVSSMPG